MAQRVKCLPAVQETWVQSLGWEDPLEKEMATHSSTFAWKIPWTEKPGRLQSMGLLRVRHDWATALSLSYLYHRKTKINKSYSAMESTFWALKDWFPPLYDPLLISVMDTVRVNRHVSHSPAARELAKQETSPWETAYPCDQRDIQVPFLLFTLQRSMCSHVPYVSVLFYMTTGQVPPQCFLIILDTESSSSILICICGWSCS